MLWSGAPDSWTFGYRGVLTASGFMACGLWVSGVRVRSSKSCRREPSSPQPVRKIRAAIGVWSYCFRLPWLPCLKGQLEEVCHSPTRISSEASPCKPGTMLKSNLTRSSDRQPAPHACRQCAAVVPDCAGLAPAPPLCRIPNDWKVEELASGLECDCSCWCYGCCSSIITKSRLSLKATITE